MPPQQQQELEAMRQQLRSMQSTISTLTSSHAPATTTSRPSEQPTQRRDSVTSTPPASPARDPALMAMPETPQSVSTSTSRLSVRSEESIRHRDALTGAIAVDKGTLSRGQAKVHAVGQVTPGPELNPYAASQPPRAVGVQPSHTSHGNLEQTPQRLAHRAQMPRQIMQPPSVPQALPVPGPAIQYQHAPQLPNPPQ